MNNPNVTDILNWTVSSGLKGETEIALLHGFCERCVNAGIPLARGTAIIDTLHPIYEGRAFFWRLDKSLETFVAEYEPSQSGRDEQQWRNSPFHQLLQSGASELRCHLETGDTKGFSVTEELRRDGQTDYIAMAQRFHRESVIGEMDCFLSRWTTAEAGGFSDADLQALRMLVPALGLAIKAASLARIAETLVETYLGRDAGKQVLEGRMTRGMVEKLHAVIWFSDMKGYTALSENMESDQLIPLLNDYAEAVIASVHNAGGDVLKLIGDGVLATFTAQSPAEACRSALAAEAELRARVSALKERRTIENLPVADVYIGLHLGDVYYGNVGSKDRLDFTVIGQAVNEASRIASMCQSAGRSVLVSSAFRDALPDADRAGLVSVGRYALRGLANAQDLFTVEAAMQ
jgi:adenylate cyclase